MSVNLTNEGVKMNPKKKRRKLKKSVKTAIISVIAATFLTVVFLTVYFVAVLQESFKLSPPTEQEIVEIQSNPISNWLFGDFIIEETNN